MRISSFEMNVTWYLEMMSFRFAIEITKYTIFYEIIYFVACRESSLSLLHIKAYIESFLFLTFAYCIISLWNEQNMFNIWDLWLSLLFWYLKLMRWFCDYVAPLCSDEFQVCSMAGESCIYMSKKIFSSSYLFNITCQRCGKFYFSSFYRDPKHVKLCLLLAFLTKEVRKILVGVN